MSNLYKKIYNDTNIIDYYKYQIEELKEENKKLKNQNLEDLNERITKAIKILSNSINHYKDYKKNNAIIKAIDILKGDNNE